MNDQIESGNVDEIFDRIKMSDFDERIFIKKIILPNDNVNYWLSSLKEIDNIDDSLPPISKLLATYNIKQKTLEVFPTVTWNMNINFNFPDKYHKIK